MTAKYSREKLLALLRLYEKDLEFIRLEIVRLRKVIEKDAGESNE